MFDSFTWMSEAWQEFPDTAALFWEAILACLQGVPLTLELTIMSVVMGFCIAVLLAVVVQKPKTLAARLTHAFTYFFTGKLIGTNIYFYYGIPSWGVVSDLMQNPNFAFLKEGFVWVLMALTLNTAAYSTIIFAGFIRNIDRGEADAARAYGMSYMQAMRRIILPSSLRARYLLIVTK